ncbi:MAG: hydroxymethylbilane synthase [Saprospirales bacterium]|nr:hydroxymethylbilane synthase [Saprospirales bacterium]
MRIGTRGSKLALWQAEFTQAELRRIGVVSELVVIETKGDVVQHLSFDKMEGEGFFTKEIEAALLRGEIDLAVHSMKDLPTSPPPDLVITAVSYRENPADWLLIRPEAREPGKIFNLRAGAVVGTSAARRKAQLVDIRPDIDVRDLCENVPARLDKVRSGAFDAVLLAAAGLRRLKPDLSGLEIVELHPREFIPAPAQGALAWQTHRDDLQTRRLLKQIHHPEVSAVTNVERRVLHLLDGDGYLPLGVFVERDARGNFHAFAAGVFDGVLRRAQVSQSTSFGLAEKIAGQLKS